MTTQEAESDKPAPFLERSLVVLLVPSYPINHHNAPPASPLNIATMEISKEEVDKVNAKMAKVAPELASPYATYPLSAQSGRSLWVNPTGGTTSNGEPCYIKGEEPQSQSIKEHYVYGPGSLGIGYYHLLTRDAYGALYARLHQSLPVTCCCFSSKEARETLDDHDTVMRICYNRSVASIPDDVQAARDAEAIARGTAKRVYNFTQNEQLVIMAINAV